MIRKFKDSDMEAVLEIWLAASIRAHDFVEPSFWESQVENMRDVYIPASETFVYEDSAGVSAFYSLNGDILAALFVAPSCQGKGIGSQLIVHAEKQRESLTLNVYKRNEAAYRFYLSRGFKVVSEQKDEHIGHMEYTMKS